MGICHDLHCRSFCCEKDLIKIFPHTWPYSSMVDNLDMLRYYSVKMGREMVQYLASICSGNSVFRNESFARNFGRRDVEAELRNSMRGLESLLWPEETATFFDQKREKLFGKRKITRNEILRAINTRSIQ